MIKGRPGEGAIGFDAPPTSLAAWRAVSAGGRRAQPTA